MFFLKLTYLFKHILLTDTKFALRAKKKKTHQAAAKQRGY